MLDLTELRARRVHSAQLRIVAGQEEDDRRELEMLAGAAAKNASFSPGGSPAGGSAAGRADGRPVGGEGAAPSPAASGGSGDLYGSAGAGVSGNGAGSPGGPRRRFSSGGVAAAGAKRGALSAMQQEMLGFELFAEKKKQQDAAVKSVGTRLGAGAAEGGEGAPSAAVAALLNDFGVDENEGRGAAASGSALAGSFEFEEDVFNNTGAGGAEAAGGAGGTAKNDGKQPKITRLGKKLPRLRRMASTDSDDLGLLEGDSASDDSSYCFSDEFDSKKKNSDDELLKQLDPDKEEDEPVKKDHSDSEKNSCDERVRFLERQIEQLRFASEAEESSEEDEEESESGASGEEERGAVGSVGGEEGEEGEEGSGEEGEEESGEEGEEESGEESGEEMAGDEDDEEDCDEEDCDEEYDEDAHADEDESEEDDEAGSSVVSRKPASRKPGKYVDPVLPDVAVENLERTSALVALSDRPMLGERIYLLLDDGCEGQWWPGW